MPIIFLGHFIKIGEEGIVNICGTNPKDLGNT